MWTWMTARMASQKSEESSKPIAACAVLLNPIADALGSVAKPFTKIYFALQVCFVSHSYAALGAV
eukprot:1156994-Pelagomonas_calceolata.AAC.10